MGKRILLIGSGNRHKAAELQEILEGLPWMVKSLADYPAVEEPVEDGATFEENAIKKAQYYGAQFDVACVADDSGLCVDALGGDPGVYSARYAGEDCTYDDNNRKLLNAMADVPKERRTARFVCVAAMVEPGGEPHLERGVVEGLLASACRGVNGFGYDPLFIPEGHECTFAEMDPEAKHAISHRGRAFSKLREYLDD